MPEKRCTFIIPIDDDQKDKVYKALEKEYGEKILSMEYSRSFSTIILRLNFDRGIEDVRRKIVEFTRYHPTHYPISEEL